MLCVSCGGDVLTDENGNMECQDQCGAVLGREEIDDAFLDDEGDIELDYDEDIDLDE
jgi:hypothetical protein